MRAQVLPDQGWQNPGYATDASSGLLLLDRIRRPRFRAALRMAGTYESG
jgi:hypothetical protein